MSRNYITVEELKSFMGPRWSDQFQEEVETWFIPYGSAGLRQLFRNSGLNLDERLEEGKVEEIVVKSVLAEMIASSLDAQSSDMPFGEMSQYSQAAGGYSISMSGITSTNLYLKKSQARLLGLPGVAIDTITLN